ncbi:MAG TPA: dicarboxylate/amino acid:cation symporter [Hyphomonadaceae bacterium]|nr:dicarboxylate/amino acid:cation symporter [Hyphomonadaceae bacterium]
MQRLIFIGLILAMILGVAVGAFVYGDPGARMNAAAQRVAQFDTNGDQHLSEEEFNASRTGDSDFTFAQVDKNKNGFATAQEIEKTSTKSQTDMASYFKILSDIFLRLIKMIVAPLVLTTLTVGIAHLGGGAAVGRIGARTMAWFVTASLCSLGLGLVMVNALQPGVNFPVTLDTAVADISTVSTGTFSLAEFITHVFPTSIADAMVKNEILQIVVISLFFGVALQALGTKAGKVTEMMEQVAFLMLKVTGYVMMAAPFAVFGAIAYTVSLQGLGVIVDYSRLVGSFFVALFILWGVLVLAGFLVLGPRVFRLLWDVRAPGLIAFATASSEAAYPRLLEQLERHGVANRVVSFVLPLGYSFNLDGSMMYCTFAVMFIAQAMGIHLDIGQQVGMLLLLMVTSKGIAGVPRASLVVISATLPAMGMKPEWIALVLAVDAFMDMGRTATNVIGNSIAAAVVAKWEGLLSDPRKDTPVIEAVLGSGESDGSAAQKV